MMARIDDVKNGDYLNALNQIDEKTKLMKKKYTKEQLAKLHAMYFIAIHFPINHPTRIVAQAELDEVLGGN
jgi:hypothetical protein